jgi:hypothetical protein
VRIHSRQVDIKHKAAQQRGKLTHKQLPIVTQLAESHHHEPPLRVEWVLTVDLATTRARARGATTATSHGRRQGPAFASASQNVVTIAALLDT